jgi:hypothetical protein
MLAAMRAEFVELNPTRIIAAILLRRVISILAFRTRECHNVTNIFLSHNNVSLSILMTYADSLWQMADSLQRATSQSAIRYRLLIQYR